jgi:hypothetical protein
MKRVRQGALLLSSIALAGVTNGYAQPSPPVPPIQIQMDTTPNFGPNVTIIDPSMSVDQINATLQSLTTASKGFDLVRNAVYFMPGTYGSAAGAADPATATDFINASIGVNETVAGLGASPDDVTINGNLRVGSTAFALGTFWRSLSNVKINPIETDEPAHTMRWNTSQACPLRRIDIAGNLDLSGGLGGGNFMADSRVSGEVTAGLEWITDPPSSAGQFYFYMRDSQIGSWVGQFVNYVFTGVVGAPATNINPNDVTTLPTTPISRDAPFLYMDHGNRFNVYIPAARTNTSGFHWGPGIQWADYSLPLHTFFIAQPTDTAETINSELSEGMNLILTPGVYKVDTAIHVTRPNTVIMGMGLASVTPIAGTAAIQVDDVPGVIISAITIDANTTNSNVLVRIGAAPRVARGPLVPLVSSRGALFSSPTTLNDVFVRVGGIYAGQATTSLEINQDNVLVDYAWLWRADHGNAGTVGWTVNTAAHGLVVNGDHVTALSLAVEHYQQTQVVWNGNDGRTIYYESEAPYDPPSQAAWMNGNQDGYPFYQVSAGVTSHYATGMVMSTLFGLECSNCPKTPIYVQSAIQTPVSPQVRFSDLTDQVILGLGGAQNMINAIGYGVDSVTGPKPFIQGVEATNQLVSFPPPVPE